MCDLRSIFKKAIADGELVLKKDFIEEITNTPFYAITQDRSDATISIWAIQAKNIQQAREYVDTGLGLDFIGDWLEACEDGKVDYVDETINADLPKADDNLVIISNLELLLIAGTHHAE